MKIRIGGDGWEEEVDSVDRAEEVMLQYTLNELEAHPIEIIDEYGREYTISVCVTLLPGRIPDIKAEYAPESTFPRSPPFRAVETDAAAAVREVLEDRGMREIKPETGRPESRAKQVQHYQEMLDDLRDQTRDVGENRILKLERDE
jgi:hypothetical protein